MFCEQVVDLALIHKCVINVQPLTLLQGWGWMDEVRASADHSRRSESIPADHLRAMYDALVDFVKVEWIEGPCEGNQSCE
jgi:hypothetical protein